MEGGVAYTNGHRLRVAILRGKESWKNKPARGVARAGMTTSHEGERSHEMLMNASWRSPYLPIRPVRLMA